MRKKIKDWKFNKVHFITRALLYQPYSLNCKKPSNLRSTPDLAVVSQKRWELSVFKKVLYNKETSNKKLIVCVTHISVFTVRFTCESTNTSMSMLKSEHSRSEFSHFVPLSAFVKQHFLCDDNRVINNASNINSEFPFPRADCN